MDITQEQLKEEGIYPKISFKEPTKAKVKLLAEKRDKIINPKGEEVTGMRYLVEHEGEKRIIVTASVSLRTQLAPYKLGDEIEIESYRKGIKLFYRVTGDKTLPVVDIDEIPIVDN